MYFTSLQNNHLILFFGGRRKTRLLKITFRICFFNTKGSTIGRSATQKEKEEAAPVLKDNDFLEKGVRIKLNPTRKAAFIEQIRRDCAVSCSLKFICISKSLYRLIY